jgi:hypothetical protein
VDTVRVGQGWCFDGLDGLGSGTDELPHCRSLKVDCVVGVRRRRTERTVGVVDPVLGAVGLDSDRSRPPGGSAGYRVGPPAEFGGQVVEWRLFELDGNGKLSVRELPPIDEGLPERRRMRSIPSDLGGLLSFKIG